MRKHLSFFVLAYLRLWAKLKLTQIKPVIIGVTGSAGKSSCVAAIEAILKEKYKVKTTGTTNSESGIPLAILGLKMADYSPFDWLRVLILAPLSLVTRHSSYDILVAEMGVDGLEPPKNMGYLLTIIRPKVGVFLNALPVHTMQMDSIEKIAAEKGKLIKALPVDGTAVLNADDPNILDLETKTAAETITFGKSAKAQVKNFTVDLDGFALTDDYGYTLSAAAAVGKVFGISSEDSKKALEKNFKLPPGRMSIFKGIKGSRILDSSYNSSPVPAFGALDLLKSYPQATRRIAVLGDMRELGDLAQKSHEVVAAKAYDCADAVITVGPLTKAYFPKSKKLLGQFDNSREAGEFLKNYLAKGDLVLFKGSQNTIFLETAVEMCLANRKDASLLCRRGEFWDKQRNETKN